MKKSLDQRILFIILLLLVITFGVLSIYQYTQLNELRIEYNKINNEFNQFKWILELGDKVVTIGKECYLRYSSLNSYDNNVIIVIYNPQDNSTLLLNIQAIQPKNNFYVPLCVQKGNALKPEEATEISQFRCLNWSGYLHVAPIIFNSNATEPGIYSVRLPNKGWYTISIVGRLGHGLGSAFHIEGLPGPVETPIYIDVIININYMEKHIMFAISELDKY